MKNLLTIRHVKQFASHVLAITLVLGLTGQFALAKKKDKKREKTQQEICELALKKPPKVQDLVEAFKAEAAENSPVISAEKLKFINVGGKDVYNISAEFNTKMNGQDIRVLMGRVEARDDEKNSEVWFFTETATRGVFEPVEGAPKYDMQDPFFFFYKGELVIGGVQVYEVPGQKNLTYDTVFFRDNGQGIASLTEFTRGPAKMKDIRGFEMEDGRLFIVARPQNEDPKLGGRGKNSFIIVNNLDGLTADAVNRAKIMQKQVRNKQWIGTNQIQSYKGKMVMLSHVAYYKHQEINDDRGYYVALYTMENPQPRIILIREMLPNGLFGESKRPDLVDVLFAGGFIINDDDTLTIYVGAGDAEAYRVTIKMPDLEEFND
ncbi:MAG: DUF1861 family protein [Bdellovibrionota bacterium]